MVSKREKAPDKRMRRRRFLENTSKLPSIEQGRSKTIKILQVESIDYWRSWRINCKK